MSLQPSKTIAAAEATRILQLYGIDTPGELVLEDLAFAMGVLVIEGPLESAVARLIRKGKRGLIRVRQGIPELGRKRFAVAHELGHWVLHEKVSQLLACSDDDLLAQYKASAPEAEANCFAAELLMPERAFAGMIQGTRPHVSVISELASRFQCSFTAAAIRYVELSDDYCAMVVSEQGRIRWWRASQSFDRRFWLDARSALPRESVAAAISRGEPAPAEPQALDSSVWLGDGYGDGEIDIEEGTIVEESLHLERYGQVISLLWLA